MTRWDLAIVCIPFIAVLFFSFYVRRYMRSVADFLAASRTAGRYLMCAAAAETGAAFAVAGLEVTSKNGFCLNLWGMFSACVTLFMILVGFVGYRFRQTRVLTFHQFFEVRYGRGVRVFAGLLNFLSGLINFGIAPGIMARFVVYFADLPTAVPIAGFSIPTYAILMLVFLSFAVFYTVSGGQVTVMLTDAIEGIISGVLYLVVGIAIVFLFSWHHFAETLLSGPPGQSYINPFDTTGHQDFNIWYILIGIVINIYGFRGISAFSTSAKTPHEAKMAGILGWWRGFVGTGFITLIGLGAFTLLHHPAFAEQAKAAEAYLGTISNESVRSQMRMPVAIRMMLPAGIRGAFLTIGIFGVIASFGSALHGLGGTFVQDVILPFRKTTLDPKKHIRLLRVGVIVVSLFGFWLSLVFTTREALVLFGTLTAAIYGGGAGAVVIGGLYWKKGTRQAAWASMVLGAALALGGRVVVETWGTLQAWAVAHTAPGTLHDYFVANAERCPINGQWMTLGILLICTAVYVVVSLATCRHAFDLDRMLHRGPYAVSEDGQPLPPPEKRKMSFTRLIGVDEQYTRGDKFIAIGIFVWEFGSNGIGLVILLWNLLLWRWTDGWWLAWFGIRHVLLIPIIGGIVVVWLSIGAARDMLRLFRSMKLVTADDSDDGTVRAHETAPPSHLQPQPAQAAPPAPEPAALDLDPEP